MSTTKIETKIVILKNSRTFEVFGYGFLTFFYALFVALIINGLMSTDSDSDDRIVFIVCLPFYVAIVIATAHATRRAHRGIYGIYDRVLLGILFFPAMGFLAAPFLVFSRNPHISLALIAGAACCALPAVVYVCLATRCLMQWVRTV
jgi:hypothetical protein